MSNNEKFNKIFSYFILIGMTVITIITTIIKLNSGDTNKAMLLVVSFGSLMGVLSCVSSANAKIFTFLFGFFDVTTYGIICLLSHKFGTASLHLLYIMPMQFVGFFQWRKRGAQSESKLKARRLNLTQWFIYGGIFLVGLAVCYLLLSFFGRDESAEIVKMAIFTDALSTMCNIIGQLLMSLAFMEQWIFWIGVNLASIAMWTITLKNSDDSSYALIYIIKYVFYLLNAINGLRIWIALSRKKKVAEIAQ